MIDALKDIPRDLTKGARHLRRLSEARLEEAPDDLRDLQFRLWRLRDSVDDEAEEQYQAIMDELAKMSRELRVASNTIQNVPRQGGPTKKMGG